MPTVDCISTKTQSDLKEEPKQKKSIWLTERDLQIILWINSHKAATAEQVANRFHMNVLTAKQRLCKLKQLDYLVYKKSISK